MSNRTLPAAKPDQWLTNSANEWSFTTALIIQSYLEQYAEQAKSEGKKLVIVNLFAGSGYVHYDEETYQGPAIVGINSPGHEKSILLEEDQDLFEALEARITRDLQDANVELLPSSPNMQVERISNLLEPYKDSNTYSILCIGTPRSLELKFGTVSELSKIEMDFLILHRLPIAAYRGPRGYINKNIERISEYLEMWEWAAILDQPQYDLDSLTRLIADMYLVKMQELGYPELDLRHVVKVGKKHTEYYLSLYSKQSWAHEAYVNANQVLETQLRLLV